MYNSVDLQLENEIWKSIPNYEGIYEASNLGRIRTDKNKITSNKRYNVRHWKQRIIKPKGETYDTGYRVSLWKNGKCKDWLVHRLIAITFLGESNLTVNHIDGNRFNNKIDNLEWISLKDNIIHGFNNGLYSTCKKIRLIDEDNNIYDFRSLSKASEYICRNTGYISCKLKTNKPVISKDNRIYQVEVL